MSTIHITSVTFYQRKRDSILYKGMSDHGPVMIKCSLSRDPAMVRAFLDEYHVMSALSHPGIPAYYGITDHFKLPDRDGSTLALCIEDCSPSSQISMHDLAWTEVMVVLSRICDLLSFLLDHGVLYTDLNPTNLLLSRAPADKEDDTGRGMDGPMERTFHVSLVDYTCCYYFLENPYPDYSLRFSYNLSPDLKGQQLLIQEMSFLLQELVDERMDQQIPSGVYRLLEAGKNPPDHLSLSDYAAMIQETYLQLI